ncbi:hypothetical protein [Patulibacter sp.]|uniref:COG4705 family protein n=1 Tax=Patulibacter sp. TaxID=1912859 RepID=UPI00271E5712|nr:hypothetical protein [Patulibacter sp.]MDO9407939.1 hypothetical protein [Patulibacter sp.]
MPRSATPKTPRLEPLAAKVPAIIALFWALKLLTTGMGEALSDFMGQTSIPLAALVGVGGFVVALRMQLRAREYRAPVYWFAVMMVAVFGTMVADGIKDGAGLSYAVTTPFFALCVAGVFWAWHRSEGTLSIHSITTRRREAFYWTAVLATFALGTAAGDLTAMTLNLGYFGSAVLFAVLMAVPALLWWRGLLNPIAAFWIAYVITRPLGASFADGFSKPDNGGLGLGDGPVSAVLLVLFVALVAWAAKARIDVQEPGEHAGPTRPHHLPGREHEGRAPSAVRP